MGFIQKKVNQAKEVAQQALTMAADGIATVRVFATSAVRDAVNREEFAALVKNRFGWDLKILSGEEEA